MEVLGPVKCANDMFYWLCLPITLNSNKLIIFTNLKYQRNKHTRLFQQTKSEKHTRLYLILNLQNTYSSLTQIKSHKTYSSLFQPQTAKIHTLLKLFLSVMKLTRLFYKQNYQKTYSSFLKFKSEKKHTRLSISPIDIIMTQKCVFILNILE